MTLNFFYCFDSGYNIQAQCSIFSLLENVSEKINISIIHKEISEKTFLDDKILNKKKLNYLSVSKFNKETSLFPNINGTHVSEATYYRIYAENYIDKNLDFLIYLDADIICYSNPIPELKMNIVNLKQSNNIISAKTENTITDGITRLDMKSNKYFNAGVLIIDYTKWIENNIQRKLSNLLVEKQTKLTFWDQDLLNIFFDSEFEELSSNLNHKMPLDQNVRILDLENDSWVTNNMIFIHYSGKFKPWNVKGILDKRSSYYQVVYRKLFKESYQVSYNYKKNALIDLINGFRRRRVFDLEFPISFIFLVLKSLFK